MRGHPYRLAVPPLPDRPAPREPIALAWTCTLASVPAWPVTIAIALLGMSMLPFALAFKALDLGSLRRPLDGFKWIPDALLLPHTVYRLVLEGADRADR